jgi:Na+/melibiose symporter-like transporter
MTVYGFIYLAASVIGATFVTPSLYSLMKHKGRVAALLNFCCGVTFFIMFFAPAPSIGFWILTFLAGVGYSAYMGTQYGLIPDAIDNGEYVVGYRCDGFLASFTSTAMKAGGAVGPAIGALVLAMLYYVPNQQQSPQVLGAMNWSVTLVPAILCMLGGVIYLCYKISGEKHRKILEELQKRRVEQYAEFAKDGD